MNYLCKINALSNLNLMAMILVSVDISKIQMSITYAYKKSHKEHVHMKSSQSEIIKIFF